MDFLACFPSMRREKASLDLAEGREERSEDWDYLVYFTVQYLDYFENKDFFFQTPPFLLDLDVANEGDLLMTAV